MKTTIVGTLAAVAFASTMAASQAQATPQSNASESNLPLHNAIISASYKGQASAMLGVEHQFADEPGSNISRIDPFGIAEPEFISADYQFIVDFADNGLLTVYSNGAINPGAYSMRFDFGASLGLALSAFTLIDTSAIGGLPLLTLIDGHTIALDLSAVQWPGDFVSFSAQLDALAPAAVPEPASVALLLAGMAGMVGLRASQRRRKRRPGN